MNRYHKYRFFHEPEKAAAAASTVDPSPEPKGLGGAFSAMLSSMADTEAKPDEKKAEVKPDEPEAKVEKKVEGVEADPFASIVKEGETGDIHPAKKEGESEKKVEAAAEPDFDSMTKGMSDKASGNFKKLKEHYTAQISNLKSEIEAAKKNAGTGDVANLQRQLDAERAEKAELLGVVEKIGLERSPTFNKKFVAGRKDVTDRLLAKVEEAGGDREAFERSLSISGKNRFQAMEDALLDVPDIAKGQIAGFVGELEKIDSERELVLKESGESLRKWEEEQILSQQEGMKKATEQRVSKFIETIPEMANDVFLLREVPAGTQGAEEWEAKRKEIITGAQHLLFNESSFEEFQKAAIMGKAYPVMQSMFLKLRTQYAALQTQVKELTGAEPGLKNGGGSEEPEAKPSTFADRVKNAMKGDG